jgi:hypothetical protein
MENLNHVFPLTDAPLNSFGNVMYYLDYQAVELLEQLLANMVVHRIIPLLKDQCGDETRVNEECALRAMVDIPWPKAAREAVYNDLSTSTQLIFSPSNLSHFLKKHDLDADKASVRIILRVLQWVALSLYQCIYEYQKFIIGRKRLVGPLIVFEAIREDEIMADICRGLFLV